MKNVCGALPCGPVYGIMPERRLKSFLRKGETNMKKLLGMLCLLLGMLCLLPLAAQAALQPGDVVYYGALEQDANAENGAEPIAWYVLQADDEKALLLSRYALMPYPFSDREKGADWETCTLRKYLNREEMLRTVLSEEELAGLVPAKITSIAALPAQGGEEQTLTAVSTVDRLFLLSQEEVDQYLTAEMLPAEPTAYALKALAYAENNRSPWWLRDSMGAQHGVMTVWADGSSFHVCDSTYQMICVRPAMYVKLSALEGNAAGSGEKTGSAFSCRMHIAQFDADYRLVQELGDEASFTDLPEGHKLGIRLLIKNESPLYQNIALALYCNGEEWKTWEEQTLDGGHSREHAVIFASAFEAVNHYAWYINGTLAAEGDLSFHAAAATEAAPAQLSYESGIAQFNADMQRVGEYRMSADFADLPEGHKLGYGIRVTNHGTEDVTVSAYPVKNGVEKSSWENKVIAPGNSWEGGVYFEEAFAADVRIQWYVNGEQVADEVLSFSNGAAQTRAGLAYEMRVCEFDENGKFLQYCQEANFAGLPEGHKLGLALCVANSGAADESVQIAMTLNGQRYSWNAATVAAGKTMRFELRITQPFEGEAQVVWTNNGETVYDASVSFLNTLQSPATSVTAL